MRPVEFTRFSLGLIVAAAFCGVLAKATPITGTINFDGVATTNSGDLTSATAFTSISGVTVVPVGLGNYAGTTGASANFTPFSFSALTVAPLWSFSVAGVNYWFDAAGVISVSHVSHGSATFLDLSGAGFANETGFDTTPGFWSITDTAVGGETTFVFGADSAVPESGATTLLIGIGMAGVGVGMIALRRKPVR